MVHHNIENEYYELRNFIEERQRLLTEQRRLVGQYGLEDPQGNIDEDLLIELFKREYSDIPILEYESEESFEHNLKQKIDHYKLLDQKRNEDFQFYRKLEESDYNELRFHPSPGIDFVNLRYHTNNPVILTEDLTERGFQAPVAVQRIINDYYPQYKHVLKEYYRPLGTTDATFEDFNKPQIPSQPPPQERIDTVLKLVKYFMDVKPFRPLKFTSTLYAKLPLSTGTGYFDRCHYKTRAIAALTRSEAYKHKPTSKGYFLNATFLAHRTQIHNMKSYQCPKPTAEDDHATRYTHWVKYIAKRATLLHTRNHISKDKPKTRPVYNVDQVFLQIETMLTFPLMIQTRPITSCLMYSLETIRGGCHYLDNIAKEYSSYFTIDWSSFDQRVPQVITDIYYTDFLESLIVIGKGYTPTLEYFEKPIPRSSDEFFPKMSNLLHSLHEWFNSMVFTTADGYSYQRTHAGIPSGLLNTQLLDSFVNIYIIIDAMLDFGFTEDEIISCKFFIMGDDNTGFTPFNLTKLDSFISYLESHSLVKWNMTMSRHKSIITELRQRIEVLGYTVNFGTPTRNLDKLIAQLAFPEHGLKPKYMSYRAIGIAYAGAGQCKTFHNFCRDIYFTFYNDRADLTVDVKEKITKHLPGIFKALDNYYDVINLERFPTIHEVREAYKKWQGSLTFSPRWDKVFFTTPPFYEGDDFETILSYRQKHNIPRKIVQRYQVNDTILNI